VIDKYHLINDTKPMFGPEKVFDMHTSEYIEHFLDPQLRYSKLIASSGAHYTALLFQDRPFHQIAEIFHHNFERWAEIMTGALNDPRSKGKKILYRTATAGHDKCYLERGGPWNEEKILETPVWNWQYIPLFNRIADVSPVCHIRFTFNVILTPSSLLFLRNSPFSLRSISLD
jgi:hypothetical protein